LRAVLDVNVLIAAALSSRGSSAQVLRAWRDRGFDLIVSPLLLEELRRAFSCPKVAERVSSQECHQFVRLLENDTVVVPDPDTPPPTRSPDPGDDYLLALAAGTRAVLVSQDQHLLSLHERYPIRTPLQFVALLSAMD
jgi:uncharacterized protein